MEIAGTLIGGAALGVLFQEFTNLLKQLKGFRKEADKLDATVKILEGYITQLDEDSIAGSPNIAKLRLLLDRGKELVEKCTQVSTWDAKKKLIYSERLRGLDEDLVRFTQIDMKCEMLMDIKMIRADLISERNMSSDSVTAEPKLPRLTFGLNGPLIEVKHKLHQKDGSVIGICGFGGCGKTTLALKLCEDEEVKAEFDIVVLTISKSPNLVEVVRKLWRKLVPEKKMPNFVGENDAIEKLTKAVQDRRPNEKPVLVVLDDVWSESVLGNLVIDRRGFKTLVTSREKFSQFQWSYQVQALEMEDAKQILLGHALSPHKDPADLNDELLSKVKDLGVDNELVGRIVRGCKGLPLALEVIGAALKKQSGKKWERTAQLLQKEGQIFENHKEILECLQSSLDMDMNPTELECFMDLGCFPEDASIPGSALIDMWVVIRGLHEHDAFEVLEKLCKRQLVVLFERTRKEAGEADGSLSGLFVKQHDLLRDLANYRSKQTNHANQTIRVVMDKGEDGRLNWHNLQQSSWRGLSMAAGTDSGFILAVLCFGLALGYLLHYVSVLLLCFLLFCSVLAYLLVGDTLSPSHLVDSFSSSFRRREDQAHTIQIVSINTGKMERNDWPSLPSFLGVEVLILNFSAESYCLPPFLGSMENLKLLIIANRSSVRAKLSDLPCLESLKKLRRIRLEKIVISATMNAYPKPLQGLEKLSINSCTFDGEEGDKGPAFDASILLPNLTELEANYCQGTLQNLLPGVCKMNELKKLSITKCPDLEKLPQEIGGLRKLEVLRLHCCSYLEGLPDSLCELECLRHLDISDCGKMEMLPEKIGALPGLKKMDVRGCLSLNDLPHLPQSVGLMVDRTTIVCYEDDAHLWEEFELTLDKRKQEVNLGFLSTT